MALAISDYPLFVAEIYDVYKALWRSKMEIPGI
jgi:hypothetical protein